MSPWNPLLSLPKASNAVLCYRKIFTLFLFSYERLIFRTQVKHEIILVACLLLDCDYIKDVKNCIPLRLAGEHIKDVSGIKSEGWDLRPL